MPYHSNKKVKKDIILYKKVKPDFQKKKNVPTSLFIIVICHFVNE